MFNPILKNKIASIAYIALWLLIVVGQWFLLSVFYNIPGSVALYDSLAFNLLFSGFGLGIWYVVRFNEFENSQIYKVAFVHFVSALIITALWISISYFIISGFYEGTKFKQFFGQSLTWRFVTGLFYYVLLALIYYLILYNENLQQKIKEEADLKALIWQAELKALKNQINPHFLFNSLNSISSLTVTKPEKAREMIVKLSDLMRYTLKANPNNKTELEDELQNINRYLAIEKIRFGNKLAYRPKISEHCKDKLLPAMILQPLIENAIKHGVYESTGNIEIILDCVFKEGFLIIEIQNNFDDELVNNTGSGIGLENLRQRLNLIYNRTDLLDITIENNVFKVNLLIPQ